MKDIDMKVFVPDNTPLTEEEKEDQKRYLASLGNFAHRHPIKKGFWDKMSALSIEGATLYTFGVDPDAIQSELKGGYENASIDLPKEFDDRLRVIESAVQTEQIKRVLITSSDSEGIDKDTLILKVSFQKWCNINSYTCTPTEAKPDFPKFQPELVDTVHSSIKLTASPSTKERESMLKIIIGMAVGAYKYDPNNERNKATGKKSGSIFADLEEAGIGIDNGTILKYINEAQELLPPK